MAWKSSCIYCVYKKGNNQIVAKKLMASVDTERKIGYIYKDGYYNATDIDSGLMCSGRHIDMRDCIKEVESDYNKIERRRLTDKYKKSVEFLNEIKEGVT